MALGADFYYNSSDNKLYSVKNLTKIVEVDTSSLDWKVDETQESHVYKWAESVHAIEVQDYDANCNEGSHEYLSQNVFNNDDKYAAKTFNMAGMLVGKNAKGIVIQQGGKKYFNK